MFQNCRLFEEKNPAISKELDKKSFQLYNMYLKFTIKPLEYANKIDFL